MYLFFLQESFHFLLCSRYKCHLKYSWSVPRTPIVERKDGVVSGFSHKIQLTPFFKPGMQTFMTKVVEIRKKNVLQVVVHAFLLYYLCFVQHVRTSFFQTLTSQETTWRRCPLPLLNTVRPCALLIHAVPTSPTTGSVGLTNCVRVK